jgi:hypothetical protein
MAEASGKYRIRSSEGSLSVLEALKVNNLMVRHCLKQESIDTSAYSSPVRNPEALDSLSKEEGLSKGGRICRLCNTWYNWEEFNVKISGLNGRESRCKNCISRLKKKHYQGKQRKEAKEKALSDKFKRIMVGSLCQSSCDVAATIIAESIQGFIDAGKL